MGLIGKEIWCLLSKRRADNSRIVAKKGNNEKEIRNAPYIFGQALIERRYPESRCAAGVPSMNGFKAAYTVA
jgi:hypothetical protein